jgi:hypothetical protein
MAGTADGAGSCCGEGDREGPTHLQCQRFPSLSSAIGDDCCTASLWPHKRAAKGVCVSCTSSAVAFCCQGDRGTRSYLKELRHGGLQQVLVHMMWVHAIIEAVVHHEGTLLLDLDRGTPLPAALLVPMVADPYGHAHARQPHDGGQAGIPHPHGACICQRPIGREVAEAGNSMGVSCACPALKIMQLLSIAPTETRGQRSPVQIAVSKAIPTVSMSSAVCHAHVIPCMTTGLHAMSLSASDQA